MSWRLSLLIAIVLLTAACTEPTTTTTVAPDVSAVTAVSTSTSLTPPTSATPPTTESSEQLATTTTSTAEETNQSLALPDNFGTDFPYVWDEIQGFIDRMSAQPDPSLVEVIIDPDCNCYQFWVELFTELDENGWYYIGDAVTSQVTVLIESEDEVGLAVTQQVPASSVVDGDGNVIREEEARVVTSSVALRRDEEGRWRIFNVVGS